MHSKFGDDATVLIVRLNSGEEVMCTTENYSNSGNEVVLKKPYIIVPVPTQDDSQSSLMIMPWMHYSKEDEILMDRDRIMFAVEPQDDFAKMYMDKSGSIIRSNSMLMT